MEEKPFFVVYEDVLKGEATKVYTSQEGVNWILQNLIDKNTPFHLHVTDTRLLKHAKPPLADDGKVR